MLKSVSVVLGSSYGDEGKGITTDYLCSKSEKPLVIRFNGGHQAGHGVHYDDKRHVFSHFGSGTLRGTPTFWSQYCTVNPVGFMNEYNHLKQLGCQPEIYIDNLCPVTTPYDTYFNRGLENIRNRNKKHGTVGVGFGATIERSKTPYKLYAQDLRFPKVLEQKLMAIHSYYLDKINGVLDTELPFSRVDFQESIQRFYDAIKDFVSIVPMITEKEFFSKDNFKYTDLIFEGGQGILLDMDFGFFPNVTYSNTTSKNAMEIINRNRIKVENPAYDSGINFSILPDEYLPAKIYYVIRAYQTRHGNGFMTNETDDLDIKQNPFETNSLNDWQGKFRKGLLDIDMLRYAIQCDLNFSHDQNHNLVITCLDQLNGTLKATRGGQQIEIDTYRDLANQISWPELDEIIGSYSDQSKDFEVFDNLSVITKDKPLLKTMKENVGS